MNIFEINNIELIPLLFQTGYLTIKNYNPEIRSYILDYPNEETKISFLSSFVSDLITISVSIFNNAALKLTQALKNNDISQ